MRWSLNVSPRQLQGRVYLGGGGTSKSQENCEALGSSFPLQSLLARSEPRGLGRRADGRAVRVRRRAEGRAVHVQAR